MNIVTERVSTPDLRTGDVIRLHGMRIELGPRGERGGVVWFLGKILNVEEVDADGFVPRSLRTDSRHPEYPPGAFWQVQGNELAHWHLEQPAPEGVTP